jgi:hypothetical protein
MQTKTKTKLGAMIVLLSLFIASTGASALSLSNRSKSLDKDSGDENVIELSGSISANLYGEKFAVVYPTIDLDTTQTLSINTTEVNGTYEVNSTLRIQVHTPDDWNTTFLVKRYLTVFATVMRKNQPLISGLLKDLFLGKSVTRINVLEKNATALYVDIPLKYNAKTQDEEQRIFILAVGNIFGLLMKSPPVIQFQTVDLVCHYSAPIVDTIPPVTKIVINGELAPGEENVYLHYADVSFVAVDDDGTAQGTPVDYTSFRYTYTTPGGVEGQQTPWITYDTAQKFIQSGQYYIEYYSVDRAGNFESPQTANFEIR